MSESPLDRLSPEERRRWRLIVGPNADKPGERPPLSDEHDVRRDRCLELVYGSGDGYGYAPAPKLGAGKSRGGPGNPAPFVPEWLEDLRRSFPRPVIEHVQREALKQRGWERLLLEPENLAVLEHDATLVAALLALKDMVPEETKALARNVVAEVVRKIEEELTFKILSALAGRPSPSRLRRTGPASRIDWNRTIRKSLKHYQPEVETVVPDPVLFRDAERRQFDDRRVILLIDQSGSMATSLVYAAVMGSVLATLKNLSTHVLLFDVGVVDVSEELSDPVDVLFGATLGGGTSIRTALAAAQARVTEPARTLVVLISDLMEGENPRLMLTRMGELKAAGVTVLCLLSLQPDGVPVYSRANAQEVARLGIPVFACTPDRLVDVLRCVMDGHGLATLGIATPLAEEP